MSVHSRHCDGGGAAGALLSSFVLLWAFCREPLSALGAIGSVLPPTDTVAAVQLLAADVAVAFMPAVAAGAFVAAAWMFFATSTSCSGVQKIDLRFLDGSELRELHRYERWNENKNRARGRIGGNLYKGASAWTQRVRHFRTHRFQTRSGLDGATHLPKA